MNHIFLNTLNLLSVLGNNNPSKSAFATSYDSTQGVYPIVQLAILIFGTAFILYVFFKVRHMLKLEEKNKIQKLLLKKRKKPTTLNSK